MEPKLRVAFWILGPLGATIAGSLGLFFGGIAWFIWIGRS